MMPSVEVVSLLLCLPVAFVLDPVAPLLILGLCLRLGWITDPLLLRPEFAGFADPIFLVAATAVFIAHALADKFPPVGHVLDVIGTVIKPLAVAFCGFLVTNKINMPASQHWVILGVVLAGSVPATAGLQITKLKLRLAASATSAGLAHPFISTVENLLGLTLAFLAVTHPTLAVGLVIVIGIPLLWGVWKLIGALKRAAKRAKDKLAQLSENLPFQQSKSE